MRFLVKLLLLVSQIVVMAWLAKARRQLVIQQSDWEGEDRSCLRDDGTYLGFVTSYKPSKRANNIAISLVGETPPDGRKRQPEYWVAWEWVRSRLILHAGETRDSLVLDRRRAKRQERSARVAIGGVSGDNVGPTTKSLRVTKLQRLLGTAGERRNEDRRTLLHRL